MENFEPIDVSFIINEPEVKKASENLKNSISGAAETAEQSTARANKRIKEMFDMSNKSIERQTKALANQKPQWNGMQNSINQLSRELPAFTYSVQTGFMAISNNLPILADEINRLRAANKALTDSGQKAVPVWKQLVQAGLSWQTMLSVGITLLTVYGKEVGEWVMALFKGKDALDEVKQSQEALNSAITGTDYSKAINDISELEGVIKLAKNGQIDAKVAIDKYNDSLGKSAGFVNDLAAAEKGLVDNSDAYIRMVLYRSAATAALQDSSKEIAENQAKQIKLENKLEKLREEQRAALKLQAERKTGGDVVDANKIRLNNQLKDIAKVEAEINELEKSGKNVYNKLLGKAANIAKEFNLDLFGNEEGKPKVIDEHEKLMQRLQEIDQEYARKSFTKDEEEIQALKDKFAKIRAEVEKFNSDPKNKDKQISISGLNATENKAIQDVKYRQETEKIKQDLEDKKKLYEEYENYKKQFGIEKAKEQYKEQIGEFDSYLEYVKSKVAENQTAVVAVNKGTATGGQTERVNVLAGTSENATADETKKYNDLLASLQDYETKRNKIISDYQVVRQQLIANGNSSEVAELDKQEQEVLGKLGEAYAKDTDAYKSLISGVEDLSIKTAKTVIKNAKSMVASLLATGQITEEVAKQINDKIKKAEDSVGSGARDKFNKIAGDIYAITSEFGALGDAIGGFDSELGEAVSTMGDLATVGLDAAASITSFSTGDIVGGIKSGISAVTGVLSLFNAASESNRKHREELKKWQDEIFQSQLAYNEKLRERLLLETQINDLYESRANNIKEEYDANKKNLESNLKDQQKVFDKLLEQDVVVGKRKRVSGGILGALIGKKKTVDVEKSVAELLGIGSSYKDKDMWGNSYGLSKWTTGSAEITDEIFEKLEKINAETPLSGDAKAAYEQLVKLREEYGSIEEAQRALQIELQDIVVGNTARAIGDSIKQGFASGKRTLQDFGDDITGILQDAMLAGLDSDIIQPKMQILQDELAKFLEDGVIDENEKAQFEAMYNEVVQAGNEYIEAFNQAGIDLGDTSSSKGLTGSIRRELTEETGSELSGLFRAQYDVTKGIKVLAIENTSYNKQSVSVLNDLLKHAANTEMNTANTVARLDTLISRTEQIVTNTSKGSSTLRDSGYGGI